MKRYISKGRNSRWLTVWAAWSGPSFDDRGQRGVFEEDDELGDQGRNDIADGLGKNDVPHHLDVV